MLRLLLLLIMALTACASPDRAFWGDPAVTRQIDGRDYAVFVHRGAGPQVCLAGAALAGCRADARDAVQVIRRGYARRAEHPAILLAMRQAARDVSGCALVEGSVQGDSGVMTARLLCPD